MKYYFINTEMMDLVNEICNVVITTNDNEAKKTVKHLTIAMLRVLKENKVMNVEAVDTCINVAIQFLNSLYPELIINDFEDRIKEFLEDYAY